MELTGDSGRKSRKSAPVKNAVFVGAMHKDKTRIRPLQEQNQISGSQCLSHIESNVDEILKQGRKSRASLAKIIKTPVRMSTPVRNIQTSPRYRTRNNSKNNIRDRSRSILSSVGSRRRYHPDYDPLIEIRRAQERLDRYRSQGDWKVDMLLCDDADEDLHRYEEKLKRRFSDKSKLMEPIELERRQMELLRRQKDIDLGKVTERYAEYVLSVPKPVRERYHPRTPNKFRKVSRRAWDGMIKKWRKHLHNFDNLNFEESWRSLSTAYLSGTSSVSSNSIADSAVSSDSENASLGQFRNRLSLESFMLNQAFQSPKTLKISPTFKMTDQVKTYRSRVGDDEDTLESHPKGFHERKELFQPVIDEEDTLSAVPNPISLRRVTRNFSGQKSINGPSADILHSGLTNDMHLLAPTGQKRTTQTVGDLNSLTDFPVIRSPYAESKVNVLASPSKRTRRGILLENGLSGRGNV